LKPGGVYVGTGGSTKQMFQAMLLGPILSKSGGNRMTSMLESATRDDLLFLRDLIEADKLKPFIESRYTLEEVPEAIRYVEEGHARGKVVITVR
jgi:NADPH:quinone reductase-like Zn-dependent oxidoreductase